jgi:hypothetical protein
MFTHTEEFLADVTRIRMDVLSQKKHDSILQDMSFLNYRLAGVERFLEPKLEKPDIVWYKDETEKTIDFSDNKVTLKGEWFEGEIQRIIVSYMAMRMFEDDRFLFHASAVHYKGKSIMFMGGESNSGKTMSQIEACKRGAKIISTETIVTDENGNVIMGSKNVFLRQRAKGTERIDKPNQDEGVKKFFDEQPKFELYEGKSNIDIVVLPDIDGNYSTVVGEMKDYEKQYQTFHCLCDYLGLHILLSPGLPMPVFESNELRQKRAKFINKFSQRPYYYIRGKDPRIIIDELEKII